MNRSTHRKSVKKHTIATTGPRSTTDLCDVDVVHLDPVKTARAALPANPHLLRLTERLALLANTTRLKILLALHAGMTGPQELCVCDLAIVAGASKSMTSHQLRLLRMAGLVVQRRAGKLALYRLVDDGIADVLRAAVAGTLGPSSELSRRSNRTA